jgi:hypothetical protein
MGRSVIFSPHIFSLKGFFGIKPASDSTPTIIRHFPQSEFTRNVPQGLRQISLLWRYWLLGGALFHVLSI